MVKTFNEDILVTDANDNQAFKIEANTADLSIGATGKEGDLLIRDNRGNNVFSFSGGYPPPNPGVTPVGQTHATLSVGATDNSGELRIRDKDGRLVFQFNGETG